MSWDGLRRFDIPKAQEDGRTILEMDFISINDICNLAYQRPEFTDDWAEQTPLNFTRVKTEHSEFDVNGSDSVGNSTLSHEVEQRHLEVVEELLRAGTDANAANQYGVTADQRWRFCSRAAPTRQCATTAAGPRRPRPAIPRKPASCHG
jgi:ankyrin repeat protein